MEKLQTEAHTEETHLNQGQVDQVSGGMQLELQIWAFRTSTLSNRTAEHTVQNMGHVRKEI